MNSTSSNDCATSRKGLWTLPALIALLAIPGSACAQSVQPSQSATVSQWIAEALFEVTYDRPVARDREIWGALVPWDEIWTPSANLALKLEISSDVILAGQAVAAGEYSLWLEPRATGSWRLLLNQELTVAHNVIPEDGWVLDVEIAPRQADHMEALAVYFSDADLREGALDIHWGTTAIRVPIQVPGG